MEREDALGTAFCHKVHVEFSSHAENFYTSKRCLIFPSCYHMGTARNLENRHLFGGNRVTCILMWATGVSFCGLFLVGSLTPSITANPGAHGLLWNHNFSEIIKMRLMKMFIESCYMSALLST